MALKTNGAFEKFWSFKIEGHQLSSLWGSLSLTCSLIEAFELSAVG